MKTVILGITGSIAAYKAAGIASQLVKKGYHVFCVMTPSATEFITPLTLQVISQNSVLVTLQDEKQAWKPGHIDLADRADLVIIAPASANTSAMAVPIPEDAPVTKAVLPINPKRFSHVIGYSRLV